ncbi:MAG: glycosyltransferase family 4 protein [Kastovskya adunca ATA6-11-RM4]|jgi:glycosyltransferase involved in cell wall biosynthesis|nr:glycosyltransferase family 4 protein [Kastovskya adunca ATA6-11-RM4]
MKVLYDISVLGIGQHNPLARTGVARVVENVAYGLATSEECSLTFCGSPSFQIIKACLEYLDSNPQFRGVPLAHSNFMTNFSGKLSELNAMLEIYAKISDSLNKQSDYKSLLAELKQSLDKTKTTISKYSQLMYGSLLDEADIIHFNYYPIPQQMEQVNKISKISTICDIIPILYPQFFGLKETTDIENHIIYRSLKSLDISKDWIICISYATKNDLCNYLAIDPERVFVTPLAAASKTFYQCRLSEKLDFVRNKYGIPNEPYILSLSTLEPRKNIDRVIQCFARLVQEQNIQDLYLVLVGSKGWDYDKILEEISKQNFLKNRIILTGRVADEDLAAIYSNALAFVYPSFYEGFGLPPLEAMQCGVPVITSNTSSLPEVVGDAGIMVDPTDSDELCQSMLKIYNSPSLRETMSMKSLEQAQNFSWEKCTRETIAAYKTVLSK